jgi:hypothetical protein
MAKLTDQFIRSLRVPEGAKDVQAFDDSSPGFGVRKQASSHATFFVKYSIGKHCVPPTDCIRVATNGGNAYGFVRELTGSVSSEGDSEYRDFHTRLGASARPSTRAVNRSICALVTTAVSLRVLSPVLLSALPAQHFCIISRNARKIRARAVVLGHR